VAGAAHDGAAQAAAGAQQDGAGAQQLAAGAQQVGAGAQQFWAGAQQLDWPHELQEERQHLGLQHFTLQHLGLQQLRAWASAPTRVMLRAATATAANDNSLRVIWNPPE
jgi:hypothetical protein